MDAESVNQIVKAITSLHDGRTWKPETIFSAVAALAAAGAATVAFFLGRSQIKSAQKIAQQQIDAAERNAQRQIDSAQAAAKHQAQSAMAIAQEQIESAHSVARLNLATTMRQAWAALLRGKLASFLAACFAVYQGEDGGTTLAIATLSYELSLILDPTENTHRALTEALNKLMRASTAAPKD
jgi:hypothetical protein